MRRVAWAVTAVLVVAVLAPVAAPRGWDDYPISSYPMFARSDLGDVVELDHVILRWSDGTVRPAPPMTLGTPEVMVAMKLVAAALARGDAEELCARVASSPSLPRVDGREPAMIEVVTSRFDARRYVGGDRTPLARKVHARCIGGGAS